MSHAANQPRKWPQTDGRPCSDRFPPVALDRGASSWHQALCLQAAKASFRVLTAWIAVSLLVAALATGLVVSGAATATSVAAVAVAGLASLFFSYLECLKLIACSCEGRRI
ncbi:MAG TPA: hypothetical protein VGP86_12200 [Xanthobacteraceae bacterium]|jgi:hypothetical protein|nr:hypothetical protein [Xanthobacteraceae bacterium]